MKHVHPLLYVLITAALAAVSQGTSAQPNVRFEQQLLDHPKQNALELDLRLNVVLTEVYDPKDGSPRILLPNGFAEAKLREIWKGIPAGKTVKQVDIVCSDWPVQKSDWRPDYHVLLADRIREILTVEPSLNSKQIIWNIVLQTACDSREEAQALFHGIAVTFTDVPVAPVQTGDYAGLVDPADTITIEQANADADEKLINELAQWATIDGTIDSTVIKVLERHPEWQNMLVVMDWTSSMYPYGGQAILWQALRTQSGGIKYFAFFNDGDERFDKPLGQAGGIYYCENGKLENLIAMMNMVRSRGDGGDIPENDFEALMKSIERFPEFDEVILIADNNSWVRDFELLDSIKVPVHTIVCGNHFGINSCYINLAYRTGGSVHTIEEDIYNLAAQLEDGLVLIQGANYALTPDDLLVPMLDNSANLASDK